MMLITTELQQLLIKNGSPGQRDKDHIPVVKLFTPWGGCTWLLTEIDPDETCHAFGLCDLGMGFPELGYIDLNEVASIRGPFGLRIERDLSFKGKYPISVYAEAAREQQQVTENDAILSRHSNMRKKPPGYRHG